MEQRSVTILSFDAFAKGDDGNVVPFSLRVSHPEYDEDRGFYYAVEYPFPRDKLSPGNLAGVLPNLRPGMDEKEFEERATRMLRDHFHRWIGKPLKR